MALAAADGQGVSPPRVRGVVPRALAWLASLWWTLSWMLVAAAILVHGQIRESLDAVWLALPFGGLFVNLAAALLVNERLRRQRGLLVFHVGLAVLALIAVAGRLTALSGRVEVTEGAMFDAALVEAGVAPLHPWALDKVRFVQGAFRIDYDPGMQRRHTRSAVQVPAAGGGWETVEIGDDRPLKTFGYRFYTTPNKGFAVVLTHVASNGERRTGAVHLPSYPMHDYQQSNGWRMPGGREVQLWLDVGEPIHREDAAWTFRKPENATLVLNDGDSRHELRPGQELRLGPDLLRYEELRTWMGYTIFFDPTLPWLAAAALVASAGLGWHALAKIRAIAGDEHA